MGTVVVFIAGIIIGCTFATGILRSRSIGTLRADYSDPDSGPYLFLEITGNVDSLHRKKYVILKANIQDLIPHE